MTYSVQSTLCSTIYPYLLGKLSTVSSDPGEVITSAGLSYHKFPFCLKFKGCGF